MKKIPRHESQRGYFAHELYRQMEKDKDIWVLTGDLGYGMLDYIRRDFPDRFINCGASEQAMMGVAVGLALEGKKPFVYSITTFLLYRPYETIRNYINHEHISVRLVGSGRDSDYEHDGFSHFAGDVKPLLRNVFHNITTLWPEDKDEIPEMVKLMVDLSQPWFISLRR